jgi:hypothetical protein
MVVAIVPKSKLWNHVVSWLAWKSSSGTITWSGGCCSLQFYPCSVGLTAVFVCVRACLAGLAGIWHIVQASSFLREWFFWLGLRSGLWLWSTGSAFLEKWHQKCAWRWNVIDTPPFNTGIKSLRATLPDEISLLGIMLLEPCISLICAWKSNKWNNYSLSLLIMYGSPYMFRHYIAILRERS